MVQRLGVYARNGRGSLMDGDNDDFFPGVIRRMTIRWPWTLHEHLVHNGDHAIDVARVDMGVREDEWYGPARR
jgi:hypothetical protein